MREEVETEPVEQNAADDKEQMTAEQQAMRARVAFQALAASVLALKDEVRTLERAGLRGAANRIARIGVAQEEALAMLLGITLKRAEAAAAEQPRIILPE